MTPLKIAALNLRRTLRERTNLFFLFLFPLLLIMVLGLAFGGAYTPRLGVVPADGRLAEQLVDDLEAREGISVTLYEDRGAAVGAVERGLAEGAVVLPPGYDAEARAGRDVRVDYVSGSDRTAQQMGTIVASVVDQQSARLTVARALQGRVAPDIDASLAVADATAEAVPDIEVATTTTGEAVFPEDLGRFDANAAGQLLLFIFIVAMTTCPALIESRRLGVTRRMFASPTSVTSIVTGEAMGRVLVAAFQGLVIMAGSALLFGVSWGSPPAAVLLMLTFAVVAGGAGMLMGSLASSSEQAIALGLLLALGMGALGGSMMPLEFFSPTMLTVAHVTPHAWAADGFADLVRHDGGLGDVLPELGVLLAYGTVLFAAASWGLRRSILRG